MKSARTRRLTVDEAKTLAAQEGVVEDESLSRRLMDPVLVLQDGRAILMLRRRPLLYESVAELREAVAVGEEVMRRGPLHVASALPYGEEFAANAQELASRLASVIAISPETLDGSEASLKVLDRVLHAVPWERLLTGEVQGPLVAYIGEVIRRGSGGAWQMRLADDAKTWEPWIQDSTGRRYAPFMFAKELIEYGPKASAEAFVAAEIGFRKPAL